jgi:hypothetical protein
MSATSVDVTVRMAGKEVFTTVEVPGATSEIQRTLSAGGQSANVSLNPSSTPKVDQPPVSLKITVTGTVNLTAVAGLAVPPGGRTLDMTGKKLVGFLLRAPTANTSVVNVAPGAANPYPLLGAGNDIDLPPGSVLGFSFVDKATSLPAVGATVKNIDITIAGSDVLYLDAYLGT